jgi:hypothetical protein
MKGNLGLMSIISKNNNRLIFKSSRVLPNYLFKGLLKYPVYPIENLLILGDSTYLVKLEDPNVLITSSEST